MNNFFYRLQIFFTRLHLTLSIALVAWELFGQSYSFDTPLSIISSGFKLETGQAFALLAGVVIASGMFWSYLIGSFVDTHQIILDQLKIKEQKEKMQLEKEKIEEARLQITSKELKKNYFRDGVIFIVIMLAILIAAAVIR